jgi:signal peptidase
VTGPIEEGDVIVFESEQIQGGGLTTHRVVAETDRGLLTRGDANPFTDQDGGEPPVKRAQVVAEALQVGGHVVVVPHLGTAVEGVRSALATIQRGLAGLLGTGLFLGGQGLAYLLFSVTVLWYALTEYRRSGNRERERVASRRDGQSPRLLVAAFTLLLLAGATAAMAVPSGTQEYSVVSAEFDSDRPTVVSAGESTTLSYPVGNGGVLPVVSYVEPASEGVEVQPRELRVPGRATRNATVELHAPPQTGYYRRFVTEHRYLAVLPESVIRGLYGVHPWAPILAIDALLGVPFYLAGVRLVGTGRVRDRSRGYTPGVLARVRRALESLY